MNYISNKQNNGFIDYKTAKKRNYKYRMLTNNKKETLLHGAYTPQPGGVLTDDINTAEHFK
jgi:HKD family nuclease